MRIVSADIQSYSGLSNYKVDFEGGINLIEGKNESGKSTLCDFIRFVFYGFSSKAERNRRIGWGNESASGSLTVECDEKYFKIFRSTTAGGKDECIITDDASGNEVFADKTPGDVFLGVPEDIFVRTAYITQAGGSRVEGEKISTAIENILLSGNEQISTKKALKDLDAARIFYRHKIGNGGRLNEQKALLEEKKEQLRNGAERNSEIISKEGSLREYTSKSEENRKKLEKLNADIDYYETGERMKMVGKIFELSSRTKELTEKREEIFDLARGESGFLPDREYYESLKSSLEGVRKCDEQLETINSAKTGTEPERPDKEIEFSEYVRKKNIDGEWYDAVRSRRTLLTVVAIFATVLACLATGYGVFTFMADKFAGAVITIVGIALFVVPVIAMLLLKDKYSLPDFSRYGVDKKNLDDEIKRCREAEERYNNLIEIRNDIEGRTRIVLEDREANLKKSIELAAVWGKDTPEDALELCRNYIETTENNERALGEAMAAENAAREQFGGEEKISELLEYAEKIGLSDSGLAKIDIDRVRKEKAYVEASLKSMSEYMTTINNELLVLKATTVDIDSLSDEIQELSCEIEKGEFKCEAIDLAHKRLGDAGDAVRNEISPRLSRRAGELMSVLTGGRYKSVGVSDKLSMRYETGIGGSREIDFMSAGTKDLAYISLRFALIELLYEKEDPPVVFDESFSRLDDERLHDTLFFLNEVSKQSESQIIILTSSGRDAEVMAAIDNVNMIKM